MPRFGVWEEPDSGLSAAVMLGSPVTKAPKLLAVSDNESTPPIGNECNTEQILELNPTTTQYPIPQSQRIPTQKRSRLTPTPR